MSSRHQAGYCPHLDLATGSSGPEPRRPVPAPPPDPTADVPLMTFAQPHPPLRPFWTCRVCAEEWPCEAARAALLDAYGGHGRRDLMSFLGVQLMLAEEDLCTTLGGD